MGLRVVLMLNRSIIREAIRLFLVSQPGVEVLSAGDGASQTALLNLRPDVIMVEEGGSRRGVAAYLGKVPRAKVIALARDGGLTVHLKRETRVARLDDLLREIQAG